MLSFPGTINILLYVLPDGIETHGYRFQALQAAAADELCRFADLGVPAWSRGHELFEPTGRVIATAAKVVTGADQVFHITAPAEPVTGIHL